MERAQRLDGTMQYRARVGDATFQFVRTAKGLERENVLARDVSKVTPADWAAARQAIADYEKANAR